jgi:hypothetical protein
MTIGASSYGGIFLADFGSGTSGVTQDPWMFIWIYGAVTLSGAILGLVNWAFMNARSLVAARILNFYMCHRLVHASATRFWDLVPMGKYFPPLKIP